jgi:hypothetical protein
MGAEVVQILVADKRRVDAARLVKISPYRAALLLCNTTRQYREVNSPTAGNKTQKRAYNRAGLMRCQELSAGHTAEDMKTNSRSGLRSAYPKRVEHALSEPPSLLILVVIRVVDSLFVKIA